MWSNCIQWQSCWESETESNHSSRDIVWKEEADRQHAGLIHTVSVINYFCRINADGRHSQFGSPYFRTSERNVHPTDS